MGVPEPGRMVVLGGGESGLGAARLAAAKGWEVLLSDAGTIDPQRALAARQAGVELEQGGHEKALEQRPDLVVKSPGIPRYAPVVRAFAGIPVLGEIEFAARYSKARIVAITGSNGKTTTTSWTGHILQKAGLDAFVGGNIGQSFAAQLCERDPEYAVLEVSSFQLDDAFDFKPSISVLLNITEDHLDRYNNDVHQYAASKMRIAQNQDAEDHFIHSAEDPLTLEHLSKAPEAVRRLPFGWPKPEPNADGSMPDAAWVEDGHMHIQYRQTPFSMSIYDLALQGKHNVNNAMAAAMAARVLDIRKDVIRDALMDFRALEHRLERVASVHGIRFINDSKATNVNSVWYALESQEQPVVWIAGGVDKGNDYEALKPLVKQKVKAIICLGKDNRKLHQAFSACVDVMINTQRMDEAVRMAYHMADKDDVVLLSPACASFDLFRNYEDRGRQFKAAVKAL
jgi:UDP-N-acetylmuramoylalanine--D-glutamate ligase